MDPSHGFQPDWIEKPKKKGDGKGKGKGGHKGEGKQDKDKGRSAPMPKELHGMRSEIDGKRLCFAYNMRGGCNVSGKDRCQKGWHMFCFPGCKYPDDHGMQRCPDYAKKVMTDKGY